MYIYIDSFYKIPWSRHATNPITHIIEVNNHQGPKNHNPVGPARYIHLIPIEKYIVNDLMDCLTNNNNDILNLIFNNPINFYSYPF